jgi:hypothetical protein
LCSLPRRHRRRRRLGTLGCQLRTQRPHLGAVRVGQVCSLALPIHGRGRLGSALTGKLVLQLRCSLLRRSTPL